MTDQMRDELHRYLAANNDDDILNPEANKRAILRYHQAKQEEAAQTAVSDRSQTRARVGAGSVYPQGVGGAQIGAQRRWRVRRGHWYGGEPCWFAQSVTGTWWLMGALNFGTWREAYEYAREQASIAQLSTAGFTEDDH